MRRYVPWLLTLTAFTYYSILSAKEFTWIFVSGDSGDWLAASQMWFVPQPLGSPLFILLGHFLDLFPGDLVMKMTILLSCLPAAVIVGFVYLITKKLTDRIDIGVASSLIVLGATVLLTQATVLEEYAIAVMFATVAYWLYLRGNKGLTLFCLGLGTAIHVVLLPVTVIWLFVERKQWREYLKPTGIYLGTIIAFYSLIPIIMASGVPPFIAGDFNWYSIWIYTTGTSGAIVGNGSVFDLPMFLGKTAGILAVSLGLGIVPLTYGFKRPIEKHVWVMLGTIIFFIWYHVTNLDPSTWTFLAFTIPYFAILAGLGLAKLSKRHLQAVVAGALCLVLANGFLMNASVIAEEHPEAQETINTYMNLPEGSAVVVLHGHYSLAVFYAYSSGRDDLVPVLYYSPEVGIWPDYEDWLAEEYNVEGNSTIAWVKSLLEQDRPVYLVGEAWRYENIDEVDWARFEGNFAIHGNESQWIRGIYEQPVSY